MFASSHRLRMLFALSLIAGTARTAGAQCTTTYYSLQARVCLAKEVHYGSIAGYVRTITVPPGGRRPGSKTRIPDGVVHYKMTVKVAETIKGRASTTVELSKETSDADTRVEEWYDQKSTFLFFVNGPDKLTALRLEHPVLGETDYKSDVPPIFADDASVLRDSKKIVKAAREFVRRNAKAHKTHTFRIPRGTAELCSPSCDANFLVVPIVPRLEQTAKRMLSAPQEFVAKGTDPKWIPRYQLRRAGVDALRHFKSDDNVALLKSLLDDPSSSLTSYDFGQYKGKTVRQYDIRASAFEILRSWSIAVPEPVTVEVIGPSGQ